MGLDSLEELLLNLPALAPPPGVESNLSDPPSRRSLSLGILIPCLVITITVTLMRFYVKTFLLKKWLLEDYALLAALLFQMGHFAPAFHVYRYAPILHQWDISVRNIEKFLLDFHVGAIFYDVTILALKLSILVQFLRVFIPTGDRSFTFWMTHVVLWANTIFYIVVVFLEIFACKPMAKIWDPSITGGKCLNTPLQYLISASFNFALDFIMLVWTQKVIWSLRMSAMQKLKLGVLFLAGLIACIFGGLGVQMNVKLLQTEDKTYVSGIMALYTFPETTSGFLVLCLPVFPKFFNALMPKIFPQYLDFVKNLKARAILHTATPPHANMAEDNARNLNGRRRSLWHIPTDLEASQDDNKADEDNKVDENKKADEDTKEPQVDVEPRA